MDKVKVFNDPIHGHIALHPLLVRIIDTPQFQRLRNIKQLGGGYFVYPGASHNRFEHSIGVAHLAGELAKALRTKQLEDSKNSAEESLITDQDILCVQIAGLCHDLGHGPFSHVFEDLFNPEAEPANKKRKHEDFSAAICKDILDGNLKSEMEQYKLNEKDLIFIREMIKGPLEENKSQDEYEGRSKEKSFLYEIVANKQNGIDVDKFDYFARDCHHLGIQNNFDHRRFIVFARVCDVEADGQKHICSRDKEITNLYDMFHTRESLHRRAYQHRVKVAVEIMIKDALLKASKDKNFEYLCTAKNDMKVYTKLTDHVIEEILHHGASSNESTPSPLQEAAQILQRITSRNLYQLVGEIKLTEKGKKNIEEIKACLAKELAKAIPKDGKPDEKDNFEIIVAKFDYGMKDEDPISNYTYFYKKLKRTVGFPTPPEKVPDLLPKCFSEKILRVYWKKCDQSLEDAKKLFNAAKVLVITTGEHNQEENNDTSNDTPGNTE